MAFGLYDPSPLGTSPLGFQAIIKSRLCREAAKVGSGLWPLGEIKRKTDSHASDVGHWLGMTGFFDSLTSLAEGGEGCSAPAGAGNFLLMPSAGYFLSRKKEVFRAPARVTFGHSPKSDQKGCLKPKVSRLPTRYVLLLSAVYTTRSREFDFVVRSKGSSLRLRRCR